MREPPAHLLDTGPLRVEMRTVWKKSDADVETDAKALWRRLSVLPEGVDADLRIDEMVCAAYVEGALAAVATAFVREVEFLRHRFAMLRGLVAPEYRRHNVGRRVLAHSFIVLDRWSREHPEEAVMGVAGVLQSPILAEKATMASSPIGGFTLAGYTDRGEQIRVAWFDHARI